MCNVGTIYTSDVYRGDYLVMLDCIQLVDYILINIYYVFSSVNFSYAMIQNLVAGRLSDAATTVYSNTQSLFGQVEYCSFLKQFK